MHADGLTEGGCVGEGCREGGRAIAQHLRSGPRLSNERRALRMLLVPRVLYSRQDGGGANNGWLGGSAAAVGVQAAVIPKVSPQVAVTGVVVGSLLTPPVPEPSWLGHHSGSAGAIVDGALLAERVKAVAAITSW